MWRASIRRPDDDEAALDEGQTIEQQSEQDEVLVVNARPERAPTSSTEDAVRPTLSCLILVEVAQNANHETRRRFLLGYGALAPPGTSGAELLAHARRASPMRAAGDQLAGGRRSRPASRRTTSALCWPVLVCLDSAENRADRRAPDGLTLEPTEHPVVRGDRGIAPFSRLGFDLVKDQDRPAAHLHCLPHVLHRRRRLVDFVSHRGGPQPIRMCSNVGERVWRVTVARSSSAEADRSQQSFVSSALLRGVAGSEVGDATRIGEHPWPAPTEVEVEPIFHWQ